MHTGVEVRGQLAGGSSFLRPHGSWATNLGCEIGVNCLCRLKHPFGPSLSFLYPSTRLLQKRAFLPHCLPHPEQSVPRKPTQPSCLLCWSRSHRTLVYWHLSTSKEFQRTSLAMIRSVDQSTKWP